MIRIEVTDKVVQREVMGKNGKNVGKTFHFEEQECWAHLPGEKYPTRVRRTADKNEGVLKPGVYTLDPASIYVGSFGELCIAGSFKVLPIVTGVSVPKTGTAG